MANESEFTAHETSLSFPADDINMQRHIQFATVQNCPDNKIIKITESCEKVQTTRTYWELHLFSISC